MNKKILLLIIFVLVLTCGCTTEKKEEKVPRLEIVTKEKTSAEKFREYLKIKDRTIYIANDTEELYYVNYSKTKKTFKDHLTKTWLDIDMSMREIYDVIGDKTTMKDGSSVVYRSKDYDVTLIVCDHNNNKDMYIGTSKLAYDDKNMCQ